MVPSLNSRFLAPFNGAMEYGVNGVKALLPRLLRGAVAESRGQSSPVVGPCPQRGGRAVESATGLRVTRAFPTASVLGM